MLGIAQAQPNIALVKYWGKRPGRDNVPATPSLSRTLDSLWTRSRVEFSEAHSEDRFVINGARDDQQQLRTSRWLDEFRRTTGSTLYANVQSRNNFPTGAGLASSASGFAALVTAACAALNLNLSTGDRCRLARRGSASAARSILGGFVEMVLPALIPQLVPYSANPTGPCRCWWWSPPPPKSKQALPRE